MGKSVILRVMVLAVSCYLLITLINLWGDLNDNRRRLSEYNEKIDITTRSINSYKDLLSEGNESKIIEKAARERLGYVYADEQVFIDISGS